MWPGLRSHIRKLQSPAVLKKSALVKNVQHGMCGNIHSCLFLFFFSCKRNCHCFPNLSEGLELVKILHKIICLFFMCFVWPFLSRHKLFVSKFCVVPIFQTLRWLGMLGLCCHLPDIHVIHWGHLRVSKCSTCQALSCCVMYCHPCCFSGGSSASAVLAGNALQISICTLMQLQTHALPATSLWINTSLSAHKALELYTNTCPSGFESYSVHKEIPQSGSDLPHSCFQTRTSQQQLFCLVCAGEVRPRLVSWCQVGGLIMLPLRCAHTVLSVR